MSAAAPTPEQPEPTIVQVTATFSRQFKANVDVDALIREFSIEWTEFMRGDEPSNDDKTEFVKECLDNMGVDFFLDAPWADDVKDEDEADYEVRP